MKTYRLLFFPVLAAATACGSNNPVEPPVDAGDRVDAPPVIMLDASEPDAPPPVTCDVPLAGTIGGACGAEQACEAPADGAAGLFMYCLDAVAASPAWPTAGYCTAFFCAADADCGAGSVCGALPDGFGGTFTACLPECCDGVDPGMACSEDRMCAQSLFGDELGGVEACVPGSPDVADGAQCDEFADCDKNSVCRRDPFQFPGGQCATLKCDDTSDCAAGGDGRCADVPDQVSAICVDDCAIDTDCRWLEGYRCIDRQDGAGKFCQRAQPGDACGSMFDCGRTGEAWRCRLGNDYPGGYCTVEDCNIADNNTCPLASFCVQMTGEADTWCADQCQTIGSNECGTGYQCVEVSPPDAGGSGKRNVCVPAGGTVAAPIDT